MSDEEHEWELDMREGPLDRQGRFDMTKEECMVLAEKETGCEVGAGRPHWETPEGPPDLPTVAVSVYRLLEDLTEMERLRVIHAVKILCGDEDERIGTGPVDRR